MQCAFIGAISKHYIVDERGLEANFCLRADIGGDPKIWTSLLWSASLYGGTVFRDLSIIGYYSSSFRDYAGCWWDRMRTWCFGCICEWTLAWF